MFPDGGPCVEAADPVAALARAARFSGGGRVVGVHPESAGDDRFVVVTSATAQGQDVREARVKLQSGASTTEALGLLADWATVGGEAAPPVEVTRGPGAKPLAVVPAAAAGVAAGAAAAESSGTPAAAASPAPAAAAAPDPNAPHFEAAVRAGFAIPMGEAFGSGGTLSNKMSDYASYNIPIWVDVGVRLWGSLFLGGYFSYGFGGSTDATTCGSGFSCSPSTLRFGGQVHWHPLGSASVESMGGARVRLREAQHRGERERERDVRVLRLGVGHRSAGSRLRARLRGPHRPLGELLDRAVRLGDHRRLGRRIAERPHRQQGHPRVADGWGASGHPSVSAPGQAGLLRGRRAATLGSA